MLAVVWLFRDEIRLKIRSLAAAQAPGVSVQFANRLEEAEQTAVEADLKSLIRVNWTRRKFSPTPMSRLSPLQSHMGQS
ncbi:hypothetical protein WJ977_00700 [Achromobacter xylosoxidans]